MKVTYPLKEITKENIDSKLGSNNQYGKYPIGIYNAWHGGIHLEGAKKELLAIADGRIIAYRLAEEEKEESIDSEIDNEKKYNYSNSFILIQHDYKSPEGLEMIFYSVYHHLLSKKGIEVAGLKLPKILTQTELKVLEEPESVEGINARSAAAYKTKEFVIPKGATITFDAEETSETHWSKNFKKYNYKKVTYTDLLGTTHSDIYIATAGKRVSEAGIIQTDEDTGKPAEKGAQLKDAPKNTATITSIIKKDTVVINLEKKGNYTKIKYTQENETKEGYIWTKSLEEKETFDKSILDQIQASDLKIKAGQPIGYVGKYGVEKSPKYTATHLEVFTTKNIKKFLENTEDGKTKDGKDKQHFAKVPKDTKLKTNLEINVNIKENTPLKILKIEGDYAQIKTQDILGTVQHEHLTGWNATTQTYKIKEVHFATVNAIFNNQLSKTDKLHYKSQKGEERTVFLKVDGSNKKYWITKADLAKTIINEGCDDMYTQTAVVNDITKTNKAITKAYIEPPTENCNEETGEATQEETVNKEHITHLSKFKKVKDDKNETWYKAELTYKINEKEETKKGWLAEKDIELFSAYDWEKFGFKHLEDAGSEFVYSLKDQKTADVNATVPKDQIAPFVKTVWDIIDTDKDKKLSPIELEIAFEDPEKVEILSKLVCTHKSEWSYEIEKIKSEAQELYDIALGSSPNETLKKQVESRILALENRMKELMFWKEAKGLEYEGEVDTKLPPREFPSTDMVHYFHPLAWIRQMKLILGNGGDHGDYHDPVINPQVRGWYNTDGHNPNSSIARWNPYASMKLHKDVGHLLSDEAKKYGKPQRSSGSHNGVDLYAPVGTPVYASVDGKITMHEMTKGSSGFKIKLKGRYKEKHIRFNYIHLMQFEETKFRFYNQNSKGVIGSEYGWLNYLDYNTPQKFNDPKKEETYTIHYDNGILKIDQNEIDVTLTLEIKNLIDNNNSKVEKGQIIGYTGSTGNSYQGKKQNHLHYNTYVNSKGVQPTVLFKDYINIDIEGIETNSKQDGETSSGKW
ncbi:MAG: M23 family metallopeptidase [Flavobacteriaceae bacterium]|nr:M23 family metallopeptidase [Flavobacteriaceae bacterium]